MKTPEELAEEYSLSLLPDPRDARLLCSARKDFLAGYQAAKDQLPPFHAGADVYIIDANNPLPKPMPLSIAEQNQFADTSKVMNSPEKPDGWISVKDRLPEENQTVLIYTDKHETYMARIYDNNEAWPISNSCGCCGSEEKFTHWQPLPQPPKEES